MLEFIIHLIADYGYLIIILTIMLECAGIPLPGETALVVAAAFAGTGKLNIIFVIAAGAGSAIFGDAAGYWVGRYYGRNLISKFGRWVHLNDHRMSVLQGYFDRHGSKTVFFGRYFTILRTYSALFAGICKMPFASFVLYNALGGLTWASSFGILGYLFGHNLPLLTKIAHMIGWGLTLPLVLVVITVITWRWALKHQVKLTQKAQNYFTGSFIKKWLEAHSFQIHWLLRHWTTQQYIALHLTAGFILISCALIIFGKISYSQTAQGIIYLFDENLFRLLMSWSTPIATKVLTTVSNLSAASIIIFSILATIVFALKGRRMELTVWLVGLIGSQFLTQILKISIARQRPLTELLPSIMNSGYSFPSGHALSAIVLFGLLCYFVVLRPGTLVFRTGMITSAVIGILLVGFSRLYLQISFFSDVIGGFFAGILWLITCISVTELYRNKKIGDRRKKKRPKGAVVNPVRTCNDSQ
ncbi:MAG TPA: bifunctional DedA family/phosphatase PAP2 family protein [Chitinispirillaceae bacterium]|nr:bifunctional DedA family/phosphatase PAP2 family protein [Chitinispirillaceae bacterium]